ncbi:helix-turn-helix domain-containing protein [Streptomyces cyaneofuscatus]
MHSSIGLILHNYRVREGLTQVELADLLGISQPYLSRIIRGQRSAVSLRLWNKILEILPRPELLIVDHGMEDRTDAYDRALIAYGRGNHDLAEILLDQLADPPDPGSGVAMDLGARAQFFLASIRRDRNHLNGTSGALALYAKALLYYRANALKAKIYEVQFMMGACAEMTGQSEKALGVYHELLDQGGYAKPVLRVRAHGRIGALTTKLGDLESAAEHLERATAEAVHLDDGQPYSYYQEKLAILRTHQGRLEEAHSALRSAREEISPGDSLRRAQSLCVEANIYVAEGDLNRAEGLLQNALKVAAKYGYAHQESYIRNLSDSLSGK